METPGGRPLPVEPYPTVRVVTGPAEVEGLEGARLSEWFGELLPHFARETLRCGGEVALAPREGATEGVGLFSPGEQVTSLFSRSVAVAAALRGRHPDASAFADFPLAPGAERYLVLSAEPTGLRPDRPLAFPVRPAGARDEPAILSLIRTVHGRVDERWFDPSRPPAERCFVVELDGELAGAGCTTLVGSTGRLHSLSVHPRFRRLGIGTDLVRARLWFLFAAGARRVYSEIAERNAPSRAIAARVGLRPVGALFRHDPMIAPSPRTA